MKTKNTRKPQAPTQPAASKTQQAARLLARLSEWASDVEEFYRTSLETPGRDMTRVRYWTADRMLSDADQIAGALASLRQIVIAEAVRNA